MPRLTILSFCCESCENGSGVVCKEWCVFSVEMLWHVFFGHWWFGLLQLSQVMSF